MSYTAVYLEPLAGYRTDMRSDTLWCALCWAIRLIHGNEQLEKVLKAYTEEDSSSPFYISSAFPYKGNGSKRVHYFPIPYGFNDGQDKEQPLNLKAGKKRMRQRKVGKKKVWINKQQLEQLINGKVWVNNLDNAPTAKSIAITHNTIDRLTGSTLTLNDRGQLYHVSERYLETDKGEATGLFFLVKGNMELLEAPLRYLQHVGIGGDRSTGKGRFKINWKKFNLKEPKKANALYTLSLYCATQKELEGMNGTNFNYQLEKRSGFSGLLHQPRYPKKPLVVFKEGSVFPLAHQEQQIYGKNTIVCEQDNYKVQQYGYGFMIKMAI